MSATTRDLKVGVPADPVVGPARIRFAFWFANETLNVPELVTGVPDVENRLGILSPTSVTVPALPDALTHDDPL